MQRSTMATVFSLTLILSSWYSGWNLDAVQAADHDNVWVYVGNSHIDKAGNSVINLCQLNRKTGELKHVGDSPSISKPGFVEIHPSGKYLYAVGTSKIGELKGQGVVAAYAIDPKTRLLTPLNEQTSGGKNPCHVSVDATGQFVMCANYGSGAADAELLAVNADGTLTPPTCHVNHSGHSINTKRQEGPHPHSITMDPENLNAYVPDLGIDAVMVYHINRPSRNFQFAFSLPLKPGAGPRHLVFHPNHKFLFVCNELDNTVTVFRHHGKGQKDDVLSSKSTLPADFTSENTVAEVRTSKDGQYIYVSNRGHDSIAVFKCDAETGDLTTLGFVPSGGETPRNFNIDPSGQFMIVGNQKTGNVVLFRINQQTGMPEKTEQTLDLPGPICFRFLQDQ
jgi:6-phosphogluconolactonase